MDVWIQDNPSSAASVSGIDVEVNEKEETEWAGCKQPQTTEKI